MLAVYLGFQNVPFSSAFTGMNKGVFRCPGWTKILNPTTNWYMEGGYGWSDTIGASQDSANYKRQNISQLKEQSETIVIADSTDIELTSDQWKYLSVTPPSWSATTPLFGNRHNNGANILWLDGHVKLHKFSEIATGKSNSYGIAASEYYFKVKK